MRFEGLHQLVGYGEKDRVIRPFHQSALPTFISMPTGRLEHEKIISLFHYKYPIRWNDPTRWDITKIPVLHEIVCWFALLRHGRKILLRDQGKKISGRSLLIRNSNLVESPHL